MNFLAPYILNNVTVTEISFIGLNYAGWYDNAGLWTKNDDLTWTMNSSLSVGETTTFYVVFNTTAPGKFMNIVSITSNETSNKTANDTVEVIKADLDVQKVTINKTVLVGDHVTFEIVVHNTGKATLNNVVVREYQYEGLVFDSFIDHSGLWIKNNDLSWNLNAPLYAGEYLEFFVVFNTTTTGKFVNVIVADSDETPNKTDNDTVDVFKADIEVQKIALTPIVYVGNQTSFEIIVTNIGEVDLHNVVLEETSYEGLVYDSFVNTGIWTHSVVNGKNIWTLNKALRVHEVVTLIVNFNTTQIGNFTNIVTVGSNETQNKISNNTTNVFNQTSPDPESNSTKNPSIDIEKIALNKVVIAGNQVVFEIVVTNTGDVVLHDVTVTEDSFNGLNYDSWYDNVGLLTKNDDLTWTMNSPLYVGEIATFYIVFNTTDVGEFINIVSVDSNETDNKSDNDTVEVIKPDFTVEKITINKSVLVGEQVMFEIVVHNTGKVALNNVVVREDSFAGLIYDSFIDNTGLWIKNNDLSWKLSTPLYVGEYVGLFVVFNTTSVGNFTNVVVAGSDETENKTSNNTTVVYSIADLSIVKLVSDSNPNFGDVITWTIIVTNNGPSDSENVYVVDRLPSGLVYRFSEASIGSYDVSTGVWTIGDLAYNKTATLLIRTLVNISNKEILNIAVVSSTTPDSNPDNDKANNTTNVNPAADLSIVKYVSNENPNYGDVIIWTIVVNNRGPDVAKDVYVVDRLPSGLVYRSSEASIGSYDATTGVWTIGQLNSGATESLEITTLVKISNASILNVANINSSTYDPNKDNNRANNTTVVNPVADLSIEKVAVAIEGKYVTWAIRVTNLGPDTAINTRATDVLSNALILVEYNLTAGSFNPNTGVWTIGDMKMVM